MSAAARARTLLARRAGGLLGLLALVVAWELLARYALSGRSVLPAPQAVLADMWDGRALYLPAVGTTLAEAGQGWLWGNLAALLVGALVAGFRSLEGAALGLAAVTYCMPVIAVGPILQVLLAGSEPKVVMAAMSVFFTTLIAVLAGLRAADRTSLEIAEAFGATRRQTLWKVRAPSALPFLLVGLRIAAPAALLGAIIGEYLGGTQGLGVALISAQQTLDVPRAWGLALTAAGLAGLGYGATALVQRAVAPWSAAMASAEVALTRPRRAVEAGKGRALALACARLLLGLGGTALVWYGAIAALHLDPFFAKTPTDLWRFLASPGAAANRDQLLAASLTTVRDAAIGLACGSAAAVLLAVAFVLLPTVEQVLLPIALTLRSVPIVAMTPLLVLVLGRGLLGVGVIVSIVVFFPTLVSLTQGMRTAAPERLLLVQAYGATPWRTLRLVRLPSALPALFASARVAGPAALLGATLAEWLASGNGLGYLMLNAVTSSDFDLLWSGVVAVTAISLLAYALAGLAERLADPDRARRGRRMVAPPAIALSG